MDKITGDIQPIGFVSGKMGTALNTLSTEASTAVPNMSGQVKPVGQRIVYDAQWGSIQGDIETQEDLMEKFYEHESQALSVQDIEKILYL